MSSRRRPRATRSSVPQPSVDRTTSTAWYVLAILLLSVAIYQPAWHGGLLWDDPAHITRPELRSLNGLWRIWFDVGATQQYYPLLHSAFWLQAQLWGDAVFGYHLVNIAMHALCAVLLGVLLTRLAVPGSWLAALIFAVHPVHVESVAWMTELKNTMSGVFFLSAAIAYLRWDVSRKRTSYALALALFVFALMTKTVTAVLPPALLAVFWWRRGTLRWREDVAPLMPFFLLAVVAGVTTAWVERTFIGAAGAEFDLSPVERVLIAGRAFWFYLGKLAWPANLTFIYPRWHIDEGIWWQYLYPGLAVALVVACWIMRRRSRAPLATVLLFGGLLFPVLGFFDVFPFRYSFVADHFQYLASMPVIAAAAAGLMLLLAPRVAHQRTATGLLLLVVVLPLAVLSWRQAHDYVSADALYTATLERNPSAWLAHNNLGLLRAQDGRLSEARTHFEEAARLNPRIAEHHSNLGRLILQAGSPDAAMRHFDAALEVDPNLPNVHSDRGVALLRMGRVDDALTAFERTLALAPEHPEAQVNMAFGLRARGVERMQSGKTDQGIADLLRAVQLRPDDGAFHNDLGVAFLVAGRKAEAAEAFEAALRIQPDLVEARENLQRIKATGGR